YMARRASISLRESKHFKMEHGAIRGARV
ncbi:hypothetical protein A2U01_0099778, partial [Trifolium medium]|nr:hypothetical protein [Trifolium medium]